MVHIFGLSKHGCRIHFAPYGPVSGQLPSKIAALFAKAYFSHFRFCSERCVDCLLNMASISIIVMTQSMLVVVRWMQTSFIISSDFLPPIDIGMSTVYFQFIQSCNKQLPFRTAGTIRQNRFVHSYRYLKNAFDMIYLFVQCLNIFHDVCRNKTRNIALSLDDFSNYCRTNVGEFRLTNQKLQFLIHRQLLYSIEKLFFYIRNQMMSLTP